MICKIPEREYKHYNYIYLPTIWEHSILFIMLVMKLLEGGGSYEIKVKTNLSVRTTPTELIETWPIMLIFNY